MGDEPKWTEQKTRGGSKWKEAPPSDTKWSEEKSQGSPDWKPASKPD